ncbi:hypothetical protein [Comamonas sp.]|uniref:hypothetical protein n=1 Tax=Comamonas sp. TaxID=34028 RepID=UPI0028A12A9A|nr:hypothetical protein [Comamonas sp.]
MSNVRNQRTTHPRKAARKARAAERFSVNSTHYKTSKVYAASKDAEAAALGVSVADRMR